MKALRILSLGAVLLVRSMSLSAMQEPASNPQHMVTGQHTTNTWYDKRIQNRGVIYFYDSSKPYYFLTNFYEPQFPMKIDGYEWRTTEQYYQAGKFTDKTLRSLIRKGSHKNWKAYKPAKQSWGAWAFYVANEDPEVKEKASVRADWLHVIPGLSMQRNINRMLVGLRAKFAHGTTLGKKLLATYPKVLVEDSPLDGFFGVGDKHAAIAQGTGQNVLGRMLMHVRRELHRKQKKKAHPEHPFDVQKDFALEYLLTGGKI